MDPRLPVEHASPTVHDLRVQEVAAQIAAIAPDVPEVALERTARPARGQFLSDFYAVLHEGEQVGNCVVQTNKRSRERMFGGIAMDRKNEGFGMATYRAAILSAMAEGYDFRTHDYSQTLGAVHIWEKLHAAGVAEVVEPFTAPDKSLKSVGHFVVRAASAKS